MKKTNTTKKTKTAKPEFVFDGTGTTPNEIYYSYITAKVRSGRPITEDELTWIENTIIDTCNSIKVGDIICICERAPKKLPWYKRFWNWIRRK